MIVTTKKDETAIRKAAAAATRVILVGCSECAAICQTGGTQQVEEMKELFSDKEILATVSMESPCDKRLVTRDLRRITEELEQADTLVALTCGSGVQALAEVTGKRMIATLDTVFLGMVERLGTFDERCSLCGDCILNDTASICPVTLCPKGVRNGPCEGIHGSHCEVYPESECVWHRIYVRLKELDNLGRYTVYHSPIDWQQHHHPQEVRWKR